MRFRILAVIPLLIPSVGFSAGVLHGDWRSDFSEDALMTEAFTINSSGSVFGMIFLVSNDVCSFYVSTQTTCEEGASSSVLINTDAGALSAEIKCVKLGDSYYNMINETANVQGAVIKSKNIGIALPMESGQFKVVRFSLVGANAAITEAAERASSMQKTSDQIL